MSHLMQNLRLLLTVGEYVVGFVAVCYVGDRIWDWCEDRYWERRMRRSQARRNVP